VPKEFFVILVRSNQANIELRLSSATYKEGKTAEPRPNHKVDLSLQSAKYEWSHLPMHHSETGWFLELGCNSSSQL
jgi:hypothetical protein